MAREFFNKGYSIIFVSGREDKYRWLTLNWFYTHNIPYSELFMRPTDDKREDSVVKKEIYEKEIKGIYNVGVVFDDRNRVVEMWRDQGLTCLQVADGDF
jgi:hypothetical protein